jgi:lipopolysaccharide/colanic/teichoic acid biosynthesis glycosyltransferase
MNTVGPRPVRPLFLENLCGDIPRYPIRLTVKPGMMDLAPMGNRYCIDSKDTRRDELRYIKNRSLLLALKFIAFKLAGIPKEFSSSRLPRGVRQNLVHLCPTHPSPDTQGNL